MAAKGKSKPSELAFLDIKLMPHKYALFEDRVWCIGQMSTRDFDRLIQSYMTHARQIEMLLTGIDCTRWDCYERWFVLGELLLARKIVLYDTVEQAEQAMKEVA